MTHNTNLTPPNIKNGVNVGGVVGTLSPIGTLKEYSNGFGRDNVTITIPASETFLMFYIQGYSGHWTSYSPDSRFKKNATTGSVSQSTTDGYTYTATRSGNTVTLVRTQSNLNDMYYSGCTCYVYSM